MFNIQKINYARKAEESIASSLATSLKETGFAVLENPPLDFGLIEELYSLWAEFFETPARFDYMHNTTIQAGYFPFGSESAKNRGKSDLKEFYHFYPWHTAPKSLKTKTAYIFDQMEILGLELLDYIQSELPESIQHALSCPLKKMAMSSRASLLRVLHYPALSVDQIEEGQTRAYEHEDINLITLLPTSNVGGLMVKDVKGNWHDVPYVPKALVINTGDMLQKCTRGYFSATTHKVVESAPFISTPRYSMPMFIHPRDNVELIPGLTAGEFLRIRLKELGLLKESDWKKHSQIFSTLQSAQI